MAARCLITTSWDDGSPLDLRIAELLAKYGLQGTFYVPLQPDQQVISHSEIRALASRFEVGAHTVTHTPLTQLSWRDAEQEMTVSRAEIERITGKACPMFCFPQGKHRPRHLQLARKIGIQACRTVEMLSLAYPAEKKGMLVMPTTVQVYSHSHSALLRNLAKRGAMESAWTWTRSGLLTHWPDLAQIMLERTLSTGGVFHLWGHSWEIEQCGEWGRLESFLKNLAACAHNASFVTNFDVCRTASPKNLDAPALQETL